MSEANHIAVRIIDANLNRAREALRVMEEYARFGLDDAAMSAAIKTARHELAAAIPDTIAPALLVHRQIAGDVGREVRTDSEYARSGEVQVVQAAGKRLTEALRAVEEYGKTIDQAFGAAIERIRYRGYELEQRLLLGTCARERFGQVRLYVLLTESLCHGDWPATAEAALRGGADCLQLREKSLSDRELLVRARKLTKLCHQHGATFIVNDRPDIALASGADGVHLGQDDMSISAARAILSSTGIVGVSTHTTDQMTRAAEQSPDYIALFDTPTKPQERIAGPALLAEARTRTALPLVAIGGIDAENAGEVLSAAACCLCVCRAVIAQADVEAAAGRLRTLIDEAVE